MKNLTTLFSLFFALAIFSTVNAQTLEVNEVEGHTYECETDCLFTSCSIYCSPSQGGAICTCAWGFASCACGGNVNNGATLKYEAIDSHVSALEGMGEGELASILGQISSTGKRGGDVSGLIKEYQNRADKLPAGKQAQVRNLAK